MTLFVTRLYNFWSVLRTNNSLPQSRGRKREKKLNWTPLELGEFGRRCSVYNWQFTAGAQQSTDLCHSETRLSITFTFFGHATANSSGQYTPTYSECGWRTQQSALYSVRLTVGVSMRGEWHDTGQSPGSWILIVVARAYQSSARLNWIRSEENTDWYAWKITRGEKRDWQGNWNAIVELVVYGYCVWKLL